MNESPMFEGLKMPPTPDPVNLTQLPCDDIDLIRQDLLDAKTCLLLYREQFGVPRGLKNSHITGIIDRINKSYTFLVTITSSVEES